MDSLRRDWLHLGPSVPTVNDFGSQRYRSEIDLHKDILVFKFDLVHSSQVLIGKSSQALVYQRSSERTGPSVVSRTKSVGSQMVSGHATPRIKHVISSSIDLTYKVKDI